jgi:hypothetical protein
MIQELSVLLNELAIPHRARPVYRALREHGLLPSRLWCLSPRRGKGTAPCDCSFER